MRFYLGAYTPEMAGSAAGIGMLLAGEPASPLAGGPLGAIDGVVRKPNEGERVDAASSPSWLAAHPTLPVIYAALEGAGTVAAFRRVGDTQLEAIGRPAPAGETVCHVAVAPDGRSLVASAWGDGAVTRVGLDAAGRPVSVEVAAPATDPSSDAGEESAGVEFRRDIAGGGISGGIDLADATRALREAAGAEFAHLVPDHDAPGTPAGTATEGDPALDPAQPAGAASVDRVSRAHSAAFLPDGRVVTTDLGFDLLRFWRVTASGLRAESEVMLPRGSGPRHLVVHPSGHLHVVTEYSCEVFTLAPDAAGRWRIVGGTPASPAAGFGDAAAELARSRDGDFLYAGLRGSNTIAVLRVRGAGERVEPVALVDAGVDWPRHHVVVRDTLLVAGQRSDEVASLTLDTRTGVPGRVRFRAATPSPASILPLR